MAIYLFTSGTTWTIPAGVTTIQVECFGTANGTSDGSGTNGGSYAKTSAIAVTPGNTLRISIAAGGGNTDVWATTVATGTPVVGVTYTTSNSCLAKGGATVPASQTAASIGNAKFAGGAASTGATSANGQGGQAGPNGAGANAGASSTGGYGSSYHSGGGANGGSAPVASTYPAQTPGYGRGGSGNSQGWGGYVNTTTSTSINATQDVLGTTNFVNGSASVINYGPYGGSSGQNFGGCPSCVFGVSTTAGFIVVNTNSSAVTNGNFLAFF
jgi:hypothetical protein